jgi:RHS repeat-associated protein
LATSAIGCGRGLTDRAWGGSFDSLYKQQFVDNFAIKENELQPFKFQGQSLDIETGLHYNRFRYYDSDVGMFISRDPIGLFGGFNNFQYAPNPIEWIDPLGLARSTKSSNKSVQNPANSNDTEKPKPCIKFDTRAQAINMAKTLLGIPLSQQADTHWVVGGDIRRRGYSNYIYHPANSHWGTFYQYRNRNTQELVVVVDHTSDSRSTPHIHAGRAKSNPKTYDFKNEPYQQVKFPVDNKGNMDHHIYYCRR